MRVIQILPKQSWRLLMFFTLVFGLNMATGLAVENVLDKDIKPLFPNMLEGYIGQAPFMEPGSVIYQKPGAKGKGQAGKKRRITKFEIIRIVPFAGNNPFNTQEPINNALVNGQVVFQAVDDLAQTIAQAPVVPGPAPPVPPPVPPPAPPPAPPPGGGVACPGSVTFQVQNFGQIFVFASVGIDPNTGACGIHANSNGSALIFQSPPNGPAGVPPGEIEVFPDRLVGVWRFVAPSPAGGSVKFFPGAAQTFFIQSTTGLRRKVVANVVQNGPTNFTLNVTSVTPF